MPGAKDKTQKKDKKQERQQPAQKEKEMKKEAKAPKQGSSKLLIGVVIFVIIIIFAIGGGYVYGVIGGTQTNFATFQKNFLSAQNVGILVTDNNGTSFTATNACADNIIEQIVGSRQYHRNESTINLYVLINRTNCIYLPNGFNATNPQTVNTTYQDCLTMSAAEPRIFVNYSSTNSTIITPTTLYVSGNLKFLELCGVASEITNT